MDTIHQKTQHGLKAFQLIQFTLLAITITLFSSTAMAEKVNLNQANAETLQYIPGIGPGKSADIITLRDQTGGFKNIDELLDVPGIGEKTLEDIKKYGTLEGGVSELTEEMQENPPGKSASTSDSG